MAICDRCKADAHARCASVVYVSWPRSDRYHRRNSGSRKTGCACACKAPEGWRGTPTRLPRSMRFV